MRIRTTMKRSPCLPQPEKSLHGNKDPTQQKKKKKEKKKDGLKIKKEERGTMWYSLLRILGLWTTIEAIKFLCKNRPWAACKIQSSHVCGAEKTEARKRLGAAEDGIRSPPNLTKYFSQQTRSVTCYFSQKVMLNKYVPKLYVLGLKNCSGGGYEGGTPRLKLLSCTNISKM